MQPETHPAEAAVVAPASDLLPPQRRKGVPRITAILGIGLLGGGHLPGRDRGAEAVGWRRLGFGRRPCRGEGCGGCRTNPTARVGNDGAAGPGAGGFLRPPRPADSRAGQ